MSTLFQKTLLGQILLFGVIALSASAFSAWHLHWHLTAEYRSKGRAIARSVASSTETMIASSPPETIQAVIDEFLDIQGVAYMLVVDADREIVVGLIEEEKGHIRKLAEVQKQMGESGWRP